MDKSRINMPPGPKGHWLTGSLSALRENPMTFVAQAGHDYDGLAQFQVLNKTFYAITNPDYAHHVLVSHQAKYRRSFHYENMKLVLGDGLICSDGPIWRRQRRMIQPAFHAYALSDHVQTISACVQERFSHWDSAAKSQSFIDIAAEMKGLTLSIIGQALFGIELRQQAASFLQALTISLDVVTRRNYALLPLPLWVPIRRHRQYHKALKAVDQFLYELIAARESSTEPPSDMMGKLMAAQDGETGQKMSREELRNQLLTLFIAGFDTSANGLAWVWSLVAEHPNVFEKLTAEVDTVLQGRAPTHADLEHLTYTRQVVLESLRMYPPVYAIARKSCEEDCIDNYRIKKNGIMMISIYGMHRSPTIWPEPDQFLPERFAATQGDASNKTGYMPFGVGPRKCLGATLGIVQMQTILTMVAQRYRLSLKAGYKVEPTPLVGLVPKLGVPVQLEHRKSG